MTLSHGSLTDVNLLSCESTQPEPRISDVNRAEPEPPGAEDTLISSH